MAGDLCRSVFVHEQEVNTLRLRYSASYTILNEIQVSLAPREGCLSSHATYQQYLSEESTKQ